MPVAQWPQCDVSTQVRRLLQLERGLVIHEEEEGAAPAEPRGRDASDAHIVVAVVAVAVTVLACAESKVPVAPVLRPRRKNMKRNMAQMKPHRCLVV